MSKAWQSGCWQSLFSTHLPRKTLLPAQNMLITPGPVYLVPFVVTGDFLFCPSPSLKCTWSPPDYFMQMNSCLPKQLIAW